MTIPARNRIESIDLLKGMVMVIMALDHVRDYFHGAAYYFDPADPVQSTLPIFFTRWITHFCAPAFSFLAGVSACMVGKRKTKNELSRFLLSRGIWLVIVELTLVNFAWFFDVQFRTPGLLVIWSLGISMIALAALIHLPQKIILAFSLILIFGHNLLDNVHFENNKMWSILHEFHVFDLSNGYRLIVAYPLIPWIAVMALGYYFGTYYDKAVLPSDRKKLFNLIGITSLILFVIIRWTNLYGDPKPWQSYGYLPKDLISFLNPTKYPPSLCYLLMTLGAAFLFLANFEHLRGRVVNFFSTFGRVPFFYYILHLYLIHLLAMLYAELSGFGWHLMILPFWITKIPETKGYGVSLGVLYLIWIGIIAFLYPFCKKFDVYKQNNKDKKWLSYF
ncbi:DUF1624 domain-containing protein [soil metagenome]